MNAATEFDVGPLSWVKSEIDLALARAVQALEHYRASLSGGAADPTQLRFCRTNLHQVQGALTIVGLDGVTQFAEALEGLLDAMDGQPALCDESSCDLVRRAFDALGGYLAGLIGGQGNQPLRLLPLYREIQERRGASRHSPADLFFPDLSVRPPRSGAAAPPLAAAERSKLLRQERARFQRGLLSWLRTPQERGGVEEMAAAVRHIEASQEAGAARAFWWVAGAFLEALADAGFGADDAAIVRQLCARIDLQIRRLLEGSRNVAERLIRDTLYLVATADSTVPSVQQVRRAYALDDLLPSDADAVEAVPTENCVFARLGETLGELEEQWNRFCAGSATALAPFRENAALLCRQADEAAHTDFRRLAQVILAAGNWLGGDPARHGEALAMEVATAILLAQKARENPLQLGSDFAHQVDVTVERVHACIAGRALPPGAEVPLLDEMSRRAQEKLLLGQVAKEIQSNLQQIEQVLDGFFRDAGKRPVLAGLELAFRQIVGALAMLRQEGAVAAVQDCAESVRHLAQVEHVPVEGEYEQLASRLSMIGFYVEAIPSGVDDFAAFVRRMQTPAAGEAAVSDDEGGFSVEDEVVRNRRETHALLTAFKEQPQDAGLREEIRQNLKTLKSDADLVADARLGEQTKVLLNALDEGAAMAPQLDGVMAALKPAAVDSPPPSQETLQLSQASGEEIDGELLAIFLEEAREVLTEILGGCARLKSNPHDVEALTTIRRSFHTLKGSGRMVGLKDLGEAAWAIEQTMNLWLRAERVAEPALLELLAQAHGIFSAWVEHLATGAIGAPAPDDMIARAAALRAEGGEEQTAVVQPAVASPPSPTFATDSSGPAPALANAEIIQIDFPQVPSLDEEEVFLAPVPENAPLALAGAAEFAASASDVPAGVVEPTDQVDVSAVPAQEESSGWEGSSALRLPPLEATVTAAESELSPAAETVPAEASEGQRISISPALFDIFSNEAKTYLQTLRRELPVLESAEVLPTPHDMYRAAHTLAGISATVGLSPVEQLGHALEHALQRRDLSEQRGSLEALGIIHRCVGELELMFVALGERRAVEPVAGLVEELDALYPPALLPQPVKAETGAAAAPVPGWPDSASRESPAVAADGSTATAPAATAGRAVEGAIAAAEPAAVAAVHDEIDAQLLPIFLDEAVDLTQAIAAQLRAWRAAPDNAETVRVLARHLHTLKGSARMAGAMVLGEITHALESRVDAAGRTATATPELIDEIENATESIRQIIDRLQRGDLTAEAEANADSLPWRPDEGIAGTELAPIPGGAPAEPVGERQTPFAQLRLPADEGETEAELAVPLQGSLRVNATTIDRLVNEVGEMSIARSRIEGEMRGLKESLLDLTENVIRLRRQLREIELQAETQMQSRTAVAGDEQHAGFDPLEFDRFTRFQELTRMMAESVNDVGTVQQHLLKTLDDTNAAIQAQARVNREVQQELMAVRMMPFGSLSDRLYRVVRQAAKELDKRANLEIRGGRVELDRGVLDKIAAPLEHMLRNAVAHGIEYRAQRLAVGKPEIGDITLGLSREGNEVILSLVDDGAGLDLERIRARAVESGLLAIDEAVDDARLANFIFTPGFSTATEVSQIAGRGIGMDVVKTEIGRIGGRVDVASSAGRGTEFRLIIPLTLAMTKALLVSAAGRTYAIPSSMIEQVLDLKASELATIRDANQAEWMGNAYPFSYLPRLLGDAGAQPEAQRQSWVLLLRSGNQRVATQVDALLGNEEIVVKNIGPQLARVIGVDGATVLGDGQVVLILNPVALSMRAPSATPAPLASGVTAATAAESAGTAPAALATVMVVDDSLTVRKITGRLLAREGYQVVTARDGVEALEQLLDATPDVMLVDIEMPRMDGFDLTRNVRADARLRHIPIIMITSRTAEKHRRYAFEIGVNHYLGKPYQEDELLRCVGEAVAGLPRAG